MGILTGMSLRSTSQHYVTQAYLRHFLLEPRTGNAHLFEYTKNGLRGKKKGTKKLGCAIDFYRQYIGGEANDDLDRHRQELEQLVFEGDKNGAIFRCVTNGDYEFDSGDIASICGAAALLHCGSPVQIHNTAMAMMVCHQMYGFCNLSTPEVMQHFEDLYGENAPEEIQTVRNALFTGQLIVDVPDKLRKQLGFESFRLLERFLKTLLSMSLTIVTSDSASFITSDNPVVLTSCSRPDDPAILVYDCEVWFPLSHRLGILWRKNDYPKTVVHINQSQVNSLNERVLKWCYNSVYSPKISDVLAAAMDNHQFRPLWGYYGNLNRMAETARPMLVEDETGMVEMREVFDWVKYLRTAPIYDILGIDKALVGQPFNETGD